MVFQSLNRIKRTSIMTSIVLMAVGFVMVLCPDEYIYTLIDALGFVAMVVSVVSVFDFMSSKKALIHYITLTGALVIGIMGVAVMIFKSDMLRLIGWFSGVFLVAGGLYGIFHALIFARRSGRSGWWILIPLSLLLALFGGFIFINPWWDQTGALLKVIGGTLLFSSLVSALRLIWIWPLKGE
ncbi:MAG: DUF308 domain-containing protein [Clostridia bacterium]|nr:DUF308 domain-containing protein [Clostridia bacterium]